MYPNFEKIETQGAIGDRKNDGYRKGEGIFYQVYGPKDTSATETSLKTAIEKMPGDFDILKEHIKKGFWEPIQSYIFVFKTHRGTYPGLIEVMKQMEKNNPKITFQICDIDDLLDLFCELPEEQMEIVCDIYLPEPDFDMISYEIMGEIITYLTEIGYSHNVDMTKIPPDFEEKIIFNNISDYHAANLRVASYKIDQLDDYLASYSDNEISDNLCAIFKKLYESAKQEHPNDPTLQFQYILDSCHKPSTPKMYLQSIETNSYIIMAKYFETCDIFEEPK